MVKPLIRTRAESLAAELERDLRERQLAPGQYIGTMDELRDQTGYARSTISEAVRLLGDRGTIEIRPGRNGGLFVAPANPVVRLRHTLLTVRGGASTIAEALLVRELLEEQIDVDAAHHRSAQDSTDLRRLLTAMRTASRKGTDSFMRSNWELHDRIGQITPNQVLKAVYLSMNRCVADMSEHADNDEPGHQSEYLKARYDIHAELVGAIIAGDADRTRLAVLEHARAAVQPGDTGGTSVSATTRE